MNLFNYNFLPNKKHFALIFNTKILENNLSISDLASKFLYDEKTIYSWLNAKSLPSDIEVLKEISKMFNLSISSLLFEKNNFEKCDNKFLNDYNYFWFLIEKYAFSFLGMKEKKELINLTFNYDIYFNNLKIENLKIFDYIDTILNAKHQNYKKELTDELKNEVIFELRSKLVFVEFNEVLDELNKNEELIKYISNFDKLIINTLLKFDLYKNSKLVNYFDENNFPYFHLKELNVELNYKNILNYLSNLNYESFKNLITISEGK